MNNATLVTGGSGFIGSHLVSALLSKANRPRCLVRKKDDIAYLKSLGVELVFGDLLDKASLKEAVRGVDTIYHLAAKVRPLNLFERVKGNSNIYLETNLQGTKNLVEVCQAEKIRRFIYFSSIAAVGPGTVLTEDSVPHPVTDYGKSKLEAEKHLLQLFKSSGFPVMIIRPGMTYGPGGKAILILSRFIKTGFFPFIGDGLNLMPVCYVDDLVRATLLVAENGKAGEIYFVIENSYMIRELIEIIARAINKKFLSLYVPKNIAFGGVLIKGLCEKMLGLKFSPFFIDLSKEAVLSCVSDWTYNGKIRNELGYLPSVNLEKGIDLTVKWYRENGLI